MRMINGNNSNSDMEKRVETITAAALPETTSRRIRSTLTTLPKIKFDFSELNQLTLAVSNVVTTWYIAIVSTCWRLSKLFLSFLVG